MFDKSNQIIFYINLVLVVSGVLIAILTDYIVIGLILAICASILIYEQLRKNKSAFTISNLKKILTIHDTSGKKATLKQTQMTTACYIGNSEYWFRNIRAIGSIYNFRINDSEPTEKIKENGYYRVCVNLPTELKIINGSELTLSYQYEEAFKKTEGTLSHIIDSETKELYLIAELPEGRPISSASFLCKHGVKEEVLQPPIVTGQTRIEANIKNPELGSEYILQWIWPEESFIKKLAHFFKFQ